MKFILHSYIAKKKTILREFDILFIAQKLKPLMRAYIHIKIRDQNKHLFLCRNFQK